MKNTRTLAAAVALALPFLAAATGVLHLELVDSYPEAEQVLETSPTEIWLQFSVEPDMEQTSFSVRGPEGSVELGEIVTGDAPEVIKASVAAPLAPGSYTLSWVGAPMDDHPVRGRYTFEVAAQQGR